MSARAFRSFKNPTTHERLKELRAIVGRLSEADYHRAFERVEPHERLILLKLRGAPLPLTPVES